MDLDFKPNATLDEIVLIIEKIHQQTPLSEDVIFELPLQVQRHFGVLTQEQQWNPLPSYLTTQSSWKGRAFTFIVQTKEQEYDSTGIAFVFRCHEDPVKITNGVEISYEDSILKVDPLFKDVSVRDRRRGGEKIKLGFKNAGEVEFLGIAELEG